MTDGVNSLRSRSTTPEIMSLHLNEKRTEPGVVPSDSGIESLDNVHVETTEGTQSEPDRDKLSKMLNRLNLDPSHSTNLTHGDCLGDPKEVERPFVCSRCQTHSSEQSKSTSFRDYRKCDSYMSSRTSSLSSSDTITSGSHSYIEDLKSSSRKDHANNKNRTTKVSPENSDMARTLLSPLERSGHLLSNISSRDNNHQAPLAQFDSVEASLNDSLLHVSQRRQSLLSEILDITQSFCKCDFYSSEYCSRDHKINDEITSTNHYEFNSETGAGEQFNKSSEHLNHLKISKNCQVETLLGSSANFSQKFSTPNKNESSSQKIVSFATNKEMRNDAFKVPLIAAADNSLRSSLTALRRLEADVFDSTSDGYTSKTASELVLSKKTKDCHQRSASLGSVGAMMCDSVSDVPNCDPDDDMASVDLDRISRVTSISYSSIRQLMESTEDLVSRCYTAQPVTIDGVECIVISKEVYRQMQMDLNMLKQQLQCLSSLIQETTDLEMN